MQHNCILTVRYSNHSKIDFKASSGADAGGNGILDSWITVTVLVFVMRRWPSGLERWLRMATGDSRPGSNPTSVKTFRFGTFAIPFTPLCQCLSEETLKTVGPYYLVSMPGEVKDPNSPRWNV